MEYSDKIMGQLRTVSETLMPGENMPDDVGLLTGKTGIALFFFHLARGTGNNVYEDYAAELIDRILESLHQVKTVTYANGLAGFGAGISYLIKQQFIEGDADKVLKGIDNIIQRHTPYYLNATSETGDGKIGLGKYYTERLTNKTGLTVTGLNQTHLSSIIQALSCPYTTYRELFSVIHFLPDVMSSGVEPEKTEAYLNYAVDKMETKVYEDAYFGFYPAGGFNPLYAATLLCRASAKTGKEMYSDKAQQYLYRYEPGFRVQLNSDLQVNRLKWSFLYRYLGQRFQNNELLQLSDKWLADSLTKEFDGNTFMGLLEGCAGAGMYLLSLNNLCSDEWLDIVPFYLEKITPQIITP